MTMITMMMIKVNAHAPTDRFLPGASAIDFPLIAFLRGS
jgi:hypothetical protein